MTQATKRPGGQPPAHGRRKPAAEQWRRAPPHEAEGPHRWFAACTAREHAEVALGCACGVSTSALGRLEVRVLSIRERGPRGAGGGGGGARSAKGGRRVRLGGILALVIALLSVIVERLRVCGLSWVRAGARVSLSLFWVFGLLSVITAQVVRRVFLNGGVWVRAGPVSSPTGEEEQ